MSLRLASVFAACLLLFNSCSIAANLALDGRTKPLPSPAAGQTGLLQRLEAIKNVATELGWQGAFLPTGYLEASGAALGYEVFYARPGSTERTVVWSLADADAIVVDAGKRAEAEKTGSDTEGNQTRAYAKPLLHFKPYLDRDGALPEVALSWTDSQLSEWLVWEWAAKIYDTAKPENLSAVAFIAWKFSEAIVTKLQGPGSPELAKWRESVRDRQTFQSLSRDLYEQVQGIIEGNPDPAERLPVMQRIQKNWFGNFHQQYPNRFIGNGYVDFGKSGWIDPVEIEALDFETLGWKTWAASVNQSFSNATEILAVVGKAR